MRRRYISAAPPAARSKREIDDLRPNCTTRNARAGNRYRQLEAPRTRASRIDVQDAVARLDRGLMRVPEHDGCEAGRNRIKIELRYVMKHPKYHLPNLDRLRCREVCCPGLAINVAADGECRSNGA